jgi:hypothetical protein
LILLVTTTSFVSTKSGRESINIAHFPFIKHSFVFQISNNNMTGGMMNYKTNIIFSECSALNVVSFPTKLYRMLDDVERLGNTGIISWSNDGLFFIVHQPKVFAETCMKKYFNQSKYKR